MNLLLLLACFIQFQDPVYKYTIMGTAGQKTVGVTADEFDLATSFGHAVIKSDRVRSVTIKDGQEIIDRYYASIHYKTVTTWLKNRKKDGE